MMFSQEQYENRLRDILSQMRVARLPKGGGVDQTEVVLDGLLQSNGV
jgi:hypothetical protein